jgi:hypothetical protein
MTQQFVFEIPVAVERVNNLVVVIHCYRVNSEVTTSKILFQSNTCVSVNMESFVTRSYLPLGARKGILFPRYGVKEHREVDAYHTETAL